MEKIAVVIKNYEDSYSQEQFFIFDEGGGDIGCGDSVSFCCQDKSRSILDKHAKISFEEGFFTISAYEKGDIFYNNSHTKLEENYAVIISEGDEFLIGELNFIFVDPSKIDDHIKQNSKLINKTSNFDSLDSVKMEPFGKIDGLEIDEKLEFEIKKNTYNEDNLQTVEIKQQSKKNSDKINSQNFDDLIKNLVVELNSSIKPTTIKEYDLLDTAKVNDIISNVALSSSVKLINLTLISLIKKELYSSIYDVVGDDAFLKHLSNSITQSLLGEKDSFDYLLLKALENFLKKQQ